MPVTPVAFPENAGVAPSIKVGETANYTLDVPAEWTSSNENVLSLTVADTTNAAVTASSVQATALTAGTTTVTAALTDGTAIYETQVTVTSDSTDPTEPDLSGLPEDYQGDYTPGTTTKKVYVLDTNGIDKSTTRNPVNYLIVAPSDAKALSYYTTTSGYYNTSYHAQALDVELSADGQKIEANGIVDNALWRFNDSETTTIKNASEEVYVRNNDNIISYYYSTDWTTASQGNGSYYFRVRRSYTSDRFYYLAYSSDGGFTRTSSASYLRLYKETEETVNGYTVSTEGLRTLIDEIKALNLQESNYTSASWSAFKTALNNAESTFSKYSNAAFYNTEDDAVAAQSSINLSALNLFNAWQALVQDTTLTIEYWITNARLTGTVSQKDSCTVSSTMDGIASEQGVATVGLVDAHGTKDRREQEYWWSKLLDTTLRNSSTSGTEQQTTQNGDDETLAGTEFTRVRYMDGKWQVYTTEWVDVDLTRHQLVAYYMEVLDIANADGSSELHANIADWGARGDGGTFGYNYTGSTCTVSIQVVYEDSSTNPADESSPSQMKTKTYVYGYWDAGRGLGTLRLFGGEDYQIFKVTAETGTSRCTTGTSTLGTTFTLSSLNWDNNEIEVWSGDLMDSVAIGNPTGNPSYDSPYDHLAWNTSEHNMNNAILIRVYVKSIPKDDSLTVHYIDQSMQPENEFYKMTYRVASGTTFDPNFKFNPGHGKDFDAALSNDEILNYYGQTQHVEPDLSQLTEIGANYRYGDYELVGATLSGDGMDVYLYYTFNNTHNFVVDFGAPIEITRQDINVDGEWTSATVTGAKHGTAEVGVGKSLVYTPNDVLNQPETLTVSLQNADGSGATHIIHIVPASNVLYEETFFTRAAGTYTAWNQVAATTTEIQNADQTTLYGYDDIYATGTGNSMGSSYTATLGEGGSTNDLTTTFTGTAFDLIGTCGSDTGYVYLKIVDAAGHGRAAVIDTSYSGNYGTLHQVPLAHLVMGNTNKDYTVTVFGAYRKVANATGNTASVMRARSYAADGLDAIYDRLADDGFAPDEVEYIYFDASSELAQMDNATFAALDMADAMTDGTVAPMASTQAGSRVEIDGFRVYRTTDSTYYSVSERGMTYDRMLDMFEDKFTAYVEKDPNTGIWTSSEDYENAGGPQNEIYLEKNDAVVLNTENMTSLQITARVAGSKNGATSVTLSAATGEVSGTFRFIVTSTEMYYEIDVKDTNTLTITTTSDDVLLGLANVKYKGKMTPVTQENIDEALALLNSAPVEPEPVEPEPTVFTPERFDADIHVTRAIFRKYVTVSVKTSLDVAYITVNGQRVDSTSGRWFSWGVNGTRRFTFRDTIGRNDSVTYEVIAYDADGNASEPIILH